MSTQELTLGQLAEETGFEPRTIRSYIQQRILPGPTSMGRKAAYTEVHRWRLVALRYLKEVEGHSRLVDIRGVLAGMSPDAIEDLARRLIPPKRVKPDDSALDFIRRQKAALQQAPRVLRGPAIRYSVLEAVSRPIDTPPPTGVGAVGCEPARGAGSPAGRMPGHEVWYRIPVTDDVHLSVRGVAGSDQDAVLGYERLALQLRELIEKKSHDHGT